MKQVSFLAGALELAAVLTQVARARATCNGPECGSEVRGGSLLQRRDSTPGYFSAGTVSLDGVNEMEVQRKQTPGFPTEMLIRFPRPGKVEAAKGAYIPFGKMLTSTFVRDFHAVGSYEFGVLKWVFVKQELSAVGPGVVIGAAEKLHTLTHEGAWTKDSLNRVQQERRARSAEENEQAKALRWNRSHSVIQYHLFSGMSSQLARASTDPGVAMSIAEFVHNDPRTQFMSDRLDALSANLTRKRAEYLDGRNDNEAHEAISTADNCMHFHAHPKLRVVDHGMWLPLNVKLSGIRGETNFVPLQRFGMVYGTVMARHDEASDVIEIYMGAASQSNIVVEPGVEPSCPLNEPAMYVGPADGVGMPVPPDGRVAVPKPPDAIQPWVAHLANLWMNQMPADYSYLSQPRHKLCPQAKFSDVSGKIMNVDFMKFLRAEMSQNEMMEMSIVLTDAIDCGVEYLRGTPGWSHGFGINEATVWLHGLIEGGDILLRPTWDEFEFDI